MLGLVDPCSRPTWPLVENLFASASGSLEIGCSYFPALPFGGAYFSDIDIEAVGYAFTMGGKASVASVSRLPYLSGAFGLVVALDVVEHVEDDGTAFAEIFRVLKSDGVFILSVPLFEKYWSLFDELAGHKRRYCPAELANLLEDAGFRVERFLCPRNLWAFLWEHRWTRPIMVGLKLILAFLTASLPPSWLRVLYRVYALSPLNRMRGVAQTSWDTGWLGGVRDRSSVIIVCRKNR